MAIYVVGKGHNVIVRHGLNGIAGRIFRPNILEHWALLLPKRLDPPWKKGIHASHVRETLQVVVLHVLHQLFSFGELEGVHVALPFLWP